MAAEGRVVCRRSMYYDLKGIEYDRSPSLCTLKHAAIMHCARSKQRYYSTAVTTPACHVVASAARLAALIPDLAKSLAPYPRAGGRAARRS